MVCQILYSKITKFDQTYKVFVCRLTTLFETKADEYIETGLNFHAYHYATICQKINQKASLPLKDSFPELYNAGFNSKTGLGYMQSSFIDPFKIEMITNENLDIWEKIEKKFRLKTKELRQKIGLSKTDAPKEEKK